MDADEKNDRKARKRVCGACGFWQQTGTGNAVQGNPGECHFGPPTPMITGAIPTPRIEGVPGSGAPQIMVQSFFPPMRSTSLGCGCWQSSLAAQKQEPEGE